MRSLKLSSVLIPFVLVRDSLPRLLRFNEGDFFGCELAEFREAMAEGFDETVQLFSKDPNVASFGIEKEFC